MSLKDLKIACPEWKDINDLRFSFRERDNGSEAYSTLDVYYVIREKNHLYERQLTEYENDLRIYEDRMNQYQEDLITYRRELREYIDWCRENNQESEWHLARLENELFVEI